MLLASENIGKQDMPVDQWLASRDQSFLKRHLIPEQRDLWRFDRFADFLAAQPDVQTVYYPGLSGHPGHEIARRQMQAFGSVVSFDLATRGRAEAFLRTLKLVREATSFGGVHSTAERRARWGGDSIGEGFIRFSVGCESAEGLLEDVGGALRCVATWNDFG